HSREVARYVLIGGNEFDSRTALYGAAQLGAAGVQAAESLGIFNVIGMATRAWRAWGKDPVSNQGIIDRGQQFLARPPDDPDAPAVHERLARAYERAGNYGRAMMHVRAQATPDEARIEWLRKKLADQLLEEAEHNGNDPLVLRALVRHFGDTKAAD